MEVYLLFYVCSVQRGSAYSWRLWSGLWILIGQFKQQSVFIGLASPSGFSLVHSPCQMIFLQLLKIHFFHVILSLYFDIPGKINQLGLGNETISLQ